MSESKTIFETYYEALKRVSEDYSDSESGNDAELSSVSRAVASPPERKLNSSGGVGRVNSVLLYLILALLFVSMVGPLFDLDNYLGFRIPPS